MDGDAKLDARARLRAALATRDEADRKLKDAKRAEEHARRLLADARLAQAEFTRGEAALAAQRAAALSALVTAGGEALTTDFADLARRRDRKAELDQQIEAAEAALALLGDGSKRAERAYVIAKATAERAAQAILTSIAGDLAVALHASRTGVVNLYQELSALCRLSFLGPQGMTPLPISQEIKNEIDLAGMAVQQFRFDYGVARQPMTDWRHTYEALLKDADSALPE